MTESEQAKYCIAQMELIRTQLIHLAETVRPLNPKVAAGFNACADRLKDWREVLEEHIPEDYDLGK